MEEPKKPAAATTGEDTIFWEQILALSSSLDRVATKANAAIAIAVIAFLLHLMY